MKVLGSPATPEETAAEAAIRDVPDWQGRQVAYAPLCADVVSPVHRGVESAVWHVAPDGMSDGVLKVLRDDMAGQFDTTAAVEGAVRASDTGVGPRVLWTDAARGAIAMEYLGAGWRTATLADLQDCGVMAGVLDRARAFQAALLEQAFDVFAEIRALAARLEAAGIALPADGWWLLEQAGLIEAAVVASGRDAAPCRNDGVASNVMVADDGTVRLLDYDRAGMNDPAYDLAVILTEACAFESERAPWVEHWAGRADPALLNRTLAYGAADDLNWALWGVLNAETSPRVHVEFRKYAEWRLLRCRQTLGDPHFEERLRKL